MLSDDELLDFDIKRLGGFKRSPHTLLAEHGDVYRSHLLIARWLEGYRERRAKPRATRRADNPFEEGAQDTLRDIVAHLRQGDFLPGGPFYEDELKRER